MISKMKKEQNALFHHQRQYLPLTSLVCCRHDFFSSAAD